MSESSEVSITPTLINGRWTLNLPDHRAQRSEWKTGWEIQRLASMAANIRPDEIIYDIGTEEGDLSALFAAWAPQGGIALFEPNPRVWPNIRVIWEANDLAPPLSTWVGFASNKTDAHPAALAAQAAQASPGAIWPPCAYGPVIGDHGFACVAERGHELPQITLDDHARATGLAPSLVTMDVEGSELVVVEGMTELMVGPKPLIYISWHPSFMWYTHGQEPLDLFRYLRGFEYQEHYLGTDHEQHWAFVPRGREFVIT